MSWVPQFVKDAAKDALAVSRQLDIRTIRLGVAGSTDAEIITQLAPEFGEARVRLTLTQLREQGKIK